MWLFVYGDKLLECLVDILTMYDVYKNSMAYDSDKEEK